MPFVKIENVRALYTQSAKAQSMAHYRWMHVPNPSLQDSEQIMPVVSPRLLALLLKVPVSLAGVEAPCVDAAGGDAAIGNIDASAACSLTRGCFIWNMDRLLWSSIACRKQRLGYFPRQPMC